jgi:beta-galactosidase
MNQIEEAGLYLIARPGLYKCAEIDAGGLPAWLLAKPGPVLRCRQGGKVVCDNARTGPR